MKTKLTICLLTSLVMSTIALPASSLSSNIPSNLLSFKKSQEIESKIVSKSNFNKNYSTEGVSNYSTKDQSLFDDKYSELSFNLSKDINTLVFKTAETIMLYAIQELDIHKEKENIPLSKTIFGDYQSFKLTNNKTKKITIKNIEKLKPNPVRNLSFSKTLSARNQCRKTVEVFFEPIEIYADQLLGGDHDIYGRGNFKLRSTAEVDNQSQIVLSVSFENNERSPDYTYMRGERVFKKFVPELSNHKCKLIGISPNSGEVQGVGRWKDHSFRNYGGNGLIKNSNIRTDTVDNDLGQTGGSVSFSPIQLRFRSINSSRWKNRRRK